MVTSLSPLRPLVTAHQLKRAGIAHAVTLGVRRAPDDGGLAAHAWVQAGPVGVTGTAQAPDFTPVGFLPWRPSERRVGAAA